MHFQSSWNESAILKQYFEILRNVSIVAIKSKEMKDYIHKTAREWKWQIISIFSQYLIG